MNDKALVVVEPEAVASRPVVSGLGPQMAVAEMVQLGQIAELLADADILPKAYRGKPANVLVAAIQGVRHGWDPVTACQQIHVIDGRATMRPEAMLASVRAHGHQITGETSLTGAEVTGKRADTGEEHTAVFSIQDAERAGLCKVAPDGVTTIAKSSSGAPTPWQKYPADMCWARAVGALCRRLFPDVISGISYTPGEIEDLREQPALQRAVAETADDDEALAEADLARLKTVVATLDGSAKAEFGRRMAAKNWEALDEIPPIVRWHVLAAAEDLAAGDIPMATHDQIEALLAAEEALPEGEREPFYRDISGGRASGPESLLEAEADIAIAELGEGT